MCRGSTAMVLSHYQNTKLPSCKIPSFQPSLWLVAYHCESVTLELRKDRERFMMANPDSSTSQVYEIKVKGCLSPDWADWFNGMTLLTEVEGSNTTLRGPIVDQAALYGLLVKVHDLGLTLLSVNLVKPYRSRF